MSRIRKIKGFLLRLTYQDESSIAERWYYVTMTFGLEYGQVLQHIDCPRCNAPAVIRGRDRVRHGEAVLSENLIERHLVCKRCHLVEWCGFTTPEAFKDSKRLLKLKKLEDKHGSKIGGRVKREIAMLEERMVLYGLIGTGNGSSVSDLRRAEAAESRTSGRETLEEKEGEL